MSSKRLSVYSSMTVAGKENLNIYKTMIKDNETDAVESLNLSFTDLIPRSVDVNQHTNNDSDEEKNGKTEEYTMDPLWRKQSVSMHSYRKQSIAGLSWEMHDGRNIKNLNDIKFTHSFLLVTMLNISNNNIQVITKFIGIILNKTIN